tara:strand:- start:39 stop:557 length:519 start_codon:yes stop_codon:yes gene_type:complete
MDKRFNIHDWQAKQRLAENEDKSLQISQEEMEELHKKGKIKLKDGSTLVFIKEEDMDEASMTGTGASFKAGNSAAYATPYAFKKKRKNRMDEVSYRDFKRNTESSPRQKIAKGISQVGRMIKEIEKIVNHNFRLKTELDMNSGTFMKSTNKRIHELGARLKQIENKLREFSN